MVLPMAVYFHRATMFAVPDEYVERAAGRGAGSDGGYHVLRVAHQSLGGDAAGRGDRSAAAWSHRRHRPGECGASRGPAGSGSGVVGRAAGGCGLGLLLLGGAAVARMGLGRGGRYCRWLP